MSAFILKIIALTTMIIDHTGIFLGNNNYFEISNIFRAIGRIAFPIYVFLIAEGCKYTRDIKKYGIRLLLFGFISEIPFDLFLQRTNFSDMKSYIIRCFSYQNVFFTLALGVFSVYFAEKFRSNKRNKQSVLYIFATIIMVALGDVLKTDYGSIGILVILILYILNLKPIQESSFLMKKQNRLKQAIVLLCLCLFIMNYIFMGSLFIFATIISVILIYFYNGKRGYNLKWLFYAAYPIHLIILVALEEFI